MQHTAHGANIAKTPKTKEVAKQPVVMKDFVKGLHHHHHQSKFLHLRCQLQNPIENEDPFSGSYK